MKQTTKRAYKEQDSNINQDWEQQWSVEGRKEENGWQIEEKNEEDKRMGSVMEGADERGEGSSSIQAEDMKA